MPRSAIAPSLALALAAFVACSSQGEGQRCNVDNANDDCEAGLVCKSSRDLGGNADICCPENGPSESPECIPGGGTTTATTGTVTSTTATGMGGMGGMVGTGGMGGGTTSSTTTSTTTGMGGMGGMGGAGGN